MHSLTTTSTMATMENEVPLMSDPLMFKAELDDVKPDVGDTRPMRRAAGKPLTPAPKTAKKEESPSTPTPPPRPPSTPSQGRQLISHLPIARREAMSTFVNLDENIYQYKTLGLSKSFEESYQCDCVYEHGVSDENDACGEGSECINRLTQVECEEDECRCHSYCQNQRFQRRETAKVDVVQTEKKGFGLRAGEDIPKDAFIWEYIGEIVSHPTFMKRMREYAEEGLRHFYFMMLQKDEYIDATKKGGIGRFVNHSCSPNAYVAKWQVGKKMRMGIFAKRKILKDEELTFNYNVDRYGHDPQPCYCGEPNCVGFLGGKTQTDLSTMDDLYLEALGITDEVEALQLKGNKKKKAKKLDEDFIPEMKPIITKEVPKVVQAMKQTTSRKVMLKLLTRIKITEDPVILRAVMRLRAFSVMRALFQEFAGDLEMLHNAMECMLAFPLQNRNKVDDSKIEEEVSSLLEHENEATKALAQRLIDHWAAFSVAYRIPKRLEGDMSGNTIAETATPVEVPDEPSHKRQNFFPEIEFAGPKPLGMARVISEKPVSTKQNHIEVQTPKTGDAAKAQGVEIAALIAQARQKALEEERAREEAATAEVEAEQAKKRKREEREKEKSRKKEKLRDREAYEAEKQVNKEKRLQKLIGAVVVKTMQKYRGKDFSHDLFKKYAKEITSSICDKEKKSPSYSQNRLESLTEEKEQKIKKFTKGYMQKLVSKMKKSANDDSAKANGDVHSPNSTSEHTPQDEDADETHMTDAEVADIMEEMDVEEEKGEDKDDKDATMDVDDASPSHPTPVDPQFVDSIASLPIDSRSRTP